MARQDTRARPTRDSFWTGAIQRLNERGRRRLVLLVFLLGLGWWKGVFFTGGRHEAPPRPTDFPSEVFGGGTPVAIEFELDVEAEVYCRFATDNGVSDLDRKVWSKMIFIEKTLPAGKHSFVVSMPPRVSVRPWARCHSKAGKKLVVRVVRDGKVIASKEASADAKAEEYHYVCAAELDVLNAGG